MVTSSSPRAPKASRPKEAVARPASTAPVASSPGLTGQPDYPEIVLGEGDAAIVRREEVLLLGLGVEDQPGVHVERARADPG